MACGCSVSVWAGGLYFIIMHLYLPDSLHDEFLEIDLLPGSIKIISADVEGFALNLSSESIIVHPWNPGKVQALSTPRPNAVPGRRR